MWISYFWSHAGTALCSYSSKVWVHNKLQWCGTALYSHISMDVKWYKATWHICRLIKCEIEAMVYVVLKSSRLSSKVLLPHRQLRHLKRGASMFEYFIKCSSTWHPTGNCWSKCSNFSSLTSYLVPVIIGNNSETGKQLNIYWSVTSSSCHFTYKPTSDLTS